MWDLRNKTRKQSLNLPLDRPFPICYTALRTSDQTPVAGKEQLVMSHSDIPLSATTPHTAGPRTIRAPRGTHISCKSWQQEAALRMLMNNLDPDVAERPEDLVVYGGTGKAARNWE